MDILSKICSNSLSKYFSFIYSFFVLLNRRCMNTTVLVLAGAVQVLLRDGACLPGGVRHVLKFPVEDSPARLRRESH